MAVIENSKIDLNSSARHKRIAQMYKKQGVRRFQNKKTKKDDVFLPPVRNAFWVNITLSAELQWSLSDLLGLSRYRRANNQKVNNGAAVLNRYTNSIHICRFYQKVAFSGG